MCISLEKGFLVEEKNAQYIFHQHLHPQIVLLKINWISSIFVPVT